MTYRGHHLAVSSDLDGRFSIERHAGWALTVTSVGFKAKTIKVTDTTTDLGRIELDDDTRSIGEVVVKSKRGKYRRKDNPAVELMRRVIAAKKRTDLSNHDYYQYDRYQKITLSLNDVTDKQLKGKFFQKRSYLLDQVEVSPYNKKRILPLSVDETVSQHVYRKDPRSEKDIIRGTQSSGIGKVLATGEILNTMLKEVFTDVDSTMTTSGCCNISLCRPSVRPPSLSIISISRTPPTLTRISAIICSLFRPTSRTSAPW